MQGKGEEPTEDQAARCQWASTPGNYGGTWCSPAPLMGYMLPTRFTLDANHVLVAVFVLVVGIVAMLCEVGFQRTDDNKPNKIIVTKAMLWLLVTVALVVVSGLLMLLKIPGLGAVTKASYTVFDVSLVLVLLGILFATLRLASQPEHTMTHRGKREARMMENKKGNRLIGAALIFLFPIVNVSTAGTLTFDGEIRERFETLDGMNKKTYGDASLDFKGHVKGESDDRLLLQRMIAGFTYDMISPSQWRQVTAVRSQLMPTGTSRRPGTGSREFRVGQTLS